VKTLRREIPQMIARVIDFDALEPAKDAKTLFDEVAQRATPAETGYVRGERRVIAPVRRDRPKSPPLEVAEDWVFVVSGGGRGVVYHCVKQLARQFRCTLYVTGRTPVPKNETWLSMSDADFAAWRPTFFAEAAKSAARKTMPELREAWAGMTRARELHANLAEIEALGARVHYRTCDVADAAQVDALFAEVRKSHGRVDGILHGAMVEDSKAIPMKTPTLVARCVGAKCHGAYNMMRAARGFDVKAWINFGSGAGRFGNHGQSDYAAAGDLLAKMTAVWHRAVSPKTRCVTIDWPAWKGAGWVASNPDIEKMMQASGVATFVEIDEGVAWFVGELLFGESEEVVLAGEAMVAALVQGLG
jgi:NAD(P)-dependent dehydrogenase (short-subunit alcohol dehydrogenase family)